MGRAWDRRLGPPLTLAAQPPPVLAGCLRNAGAVAAVARTYGRNIAVIPAGERWQDAGSLRPAFEDLMGAGASISHLDGQRSPDALGARAAFRAVEAELAQAVRHCSSGKDLLEWGLASDVMLAAQLNVRTCAPVLVNDADRRAEV